ncbi:MAG: tRNA 4-thiouridine(8) synthase ThiI [bacterium]|nr:tRNA 4-thiouridine(8) synthase ThiI [bacterium]MDY4108730.1 tRNA uracil 4-sulfurtransferase ThiI [Bacilli bacterium]
MEKLIMIKYGELSTKKDNIKVFIDKLNSNVSKKLADYDVSISKNKVRMFIDIKDYNEVDIISKLKEVFGIHSIVVCYKCNKSIEDINILAKELIDKENITTFKVETNRADKSFKYNSLEVSKMVGAYLLKNVNDLKVDVHNPEITLHVEIRDDNTYLYTKEIKGLGGYPVGIQGKGLLMLSGGIDSPVAGFLASKRGIDIDCIYFDSPPHTSLEAKNKVITLAKKLCNYGNNINLYVIPFTEIQLAIYKNIEPTYMITILRRMMYRISERVAKMTKSRIIINGESIGQVASQTLNSMYVINNVTSYPVIRPVACLDKLEIIEIAKNIDTYETSILPYEDCCTIFVPKHPVINPNLDKCIYFETLIDYEKLIDEAIENMTKIDVKNYQTNSSEYL